MRLRPLLGRIRATVTSRVDRVHGQPGTASDPAPSAPATHSLLHEHNLLAAPAPVRVLLVGDDAQVLAASVCAVADDGGPLERDEAHGPRTLDAVVLGRAVPTARHQSIVAEASAAGIPVLELARQPMVDVRDINPGGWRRDTGPELGVLLAHPDRTQTWEALGRLARSFGRERLVLLVPPAWRHVDGRGLDVHALPKSPERGNVLQQLRGVVDDPDLHVSASERAQWLTEVAARGVPLLAAGLDRLDGWLHEPLEQVIACTDPAQLDDLEAREAVSIKLRRAAMRHHGARAVWRDLARQAGLHVPRGPSVSVLLASNRPGLLPEAVSRAARQQHDRLELVVAFHGDEAPPGLEATLRSRTDRPLTFLQIPAAQPLGTVLQRATEVASGDLVAKMDDDDLYDVEHVADLVDALHYSGATLVGKGSEYVYLEPLDTTIRRFPNGAEAENRNLAGGTLLLGRDDLRRIGGWQAAPRAVDQRLIDSIEQAGGTYYRTHGHGFVLMRRESGHTWNQPVDYFLRQAVAQWPGLALDAAGVR